MSDTTPTLKPKRKRKPLGRPRKKGITFAYNRPGHYARGAFFAKVKRYRRGQWTNIPHVFHWHSDITRLRRMYPEFQFRYPYPARAWVTEPGPQYGRRGYLIQVRYYHPTKRKDENQ